MNTILKVSVAGALALGGAAAHASIALPTSGSSDLILFAEVVNSSNTAVASYAGDTGLSISSALSLTGTHSYLTGDSILSALFAADGAGDTLVWALEGGAFTGTVTPKNFDGPGNANFLTTSTGDSTANMATETVNNLEGWASSLATAIGTLNTNLAGKNSVEGASPATAGVWDYNTPSAISGWNLNGPTTGNVVGSTQQLFYVTGGGNGTTGAYGTDLIAFTDIAGAALTSNGLSITVQGAPVPLPAAVWLLGSGLLGLTGIARRKAKA